jgi:hypothetical protein
MPDIQTYLTQESQHWFFTVLYLSILKNPIQAEKTYEVAILQVCTISCSELIFHIVRILFLDLDPAHKNQDPDLNKGLKTSVAEPQNCYAIPAPGKNFLSTRESLNGRDLF